MMTFDLSQPGTEPKVKYSDTERRMFGVLKRNTLNRDRGITIEQLTTKWYNGDETPFHGKTIVRLIVERLLQKMQANREQIVIEKDKVKTDFIRYQLRKK